MFVSVFIESYSSRFYLIGIIQIALEFRKCEASLDYTHLHILRAQFNTLVNNYLSDANIAQMGFRRSKCPPLQKT